MKDIRNKTEQPTVSLEAETLMRVLGYQFKDCSLLHTALRHRSYVARDAAGQHGVNNERLEFLGDAVLSIVTANFLYHHNSHLNEGDLSRLRANYVCQETLSQAGKKLDVGNFIQSDKAMRASGSNNSKAILADTIEALFGAVFLDGGLEAAEAVIFHTLGKPSTKLVVLEKDAKTRLQEIIQANVHDAPRYVVLDAIGPPHAPTFLVGVKIKDEIFATATGENKRAAAHNAACIALEKISASPRTDFLP